MRLKKIFIGEKGIRAGWRLLIYLAILALFGWLSGLLLGPPLIRDDWLNQWAPLPFIVAESIGGTGIVLTLIVTAILARIERRRPARFGLPLTRTSGRLLGAGLAWGFGTVAALAGLIAIAGGLTFRGLHLHGGEFVTTALLWGAAMLLVGLAEEYLFRGYLLVTLSEGIGFWPAAVILSLLFGAVHYFFKPMETPADALSVSLLGLFLCLSFRRTGNLWFAVGFHAAFDYAALIVLGAPNTGNGGKAVASRLFDVAFAGPRWVTGAQCGMEASWLIFPLIAILFILLVRRWRSLSHPF